MAELLNRQKASEILGISPNEVNKLAKEGKLKSVTKGNCRYYTREDLQAFMKKKKK